MKATRPFVVLMVALFLIMMIIQTMTPKRFNWAATYAHVSDQPFGCALFDSVMAASIPQGYTTTSLTLAQLENAAPHDEPHIYVIIANGEPFSEADAEALVRMLQRGDQFFVASGYWYNRTLEEQLNVSVDGYPGLSPSMLKQNVMNHDQDTLTWSSTMAAMNKRTWIIPPELCNRASFVTHGGDRRNFAPLLTRRYFVGEGVQWDDQISDYVPVPAGFVNDTLAALVRYDKGGKMVVCSTPLLFTNYGVVENQTAQLALRMFSVLDRYPVVRIDPAAKTAVGGVSESPLRYVMSQPPLRWAAWLLMVAVALGMIFTARRRQRVIPMMEPPVNRSLEMVKHIGSLYFFRRDNADLMYKKYQFFVEDVRKLAMIDLDDEAHHSDALTQLHHMTGMPRQELEQQLHNIVGWTTEQPSDQTLMRSIDYLNLILSKLK